MIIRINCCQSPKVLAKPDSGRPFHKSPELFPLKNEKGFPLFIPSTNVHYKGIFDAVLRNTLLVKMDKVIAITREDFRIAFTSLFLVFLIFV